MDYLCSCWEWRNEYRCLLSSWLDSTFKKWDSPRPSFVFRVEQGLDMATGTSIKKKTTKHFSASLYSTILLIERGVQVGLTMKSTSLMQGRAIEPCILFICMSVLPWHTVSVLTYQPPNLYKSFQISGTRFASISSELYFEARID